MQRQRRTGQKILVPLGDEDIDDNIHTPKPVSIAKGAPNTIKLKRLRRRKHIRKGSRLDWILLGIIFTAIAVVIFGIAFAFVLLFSWFFDPHTSVFGRKVFHNEIKLDHDLYHRRHNNMTDLNGNSRSEIKLEDSGQDSLTSYGTDVMSSGCSITVFLMDPRLPKLESTSPWFTLESIAAFLPDACVIIQTARCRVEEEYVIKRIKKAALPLFLGMIKKGQVRVSYLDHIKYNVKDCDFFNPSAVFMNFNFWNDEFINDVDSDTVLIIQDDAVLCHKFDVQNWKEFAFVGAPWTKQTGFIEGLCLGMSMRWKSWTLPQKQWQSSLKGEGDSKKHPKPDVLLDLDFPEICSGNGSGPVGNGGLSIRSRTWMMNAISTCPHVKWSGIDLNALSNYACKVHEIINEDLYFGIVLRGMHAPLPTAYEASLFSLEMMWPEEMAKEYGGINAYSTQKQIAKHFFGDLGISYALFQGIYFNDEYLTMPIGIHKPWQHQKHELLDSVDVKEQCPFLQYIFQPLDEK